MPLESTMLCLDNSDWMRNGDYAPTRLESQQDAAGMIINDRLNSNPENTVGVLTMAGTGVDMRVSPTEEAGKILACFSGITIGGKSDLSTAVQIAQLALKHRKNKNGGQRIIVFVGGPVAEPVDKLQKIGKQLKKNNVAVDVISLGEVEENSEKLLEFVNAVNSNDNSHLITVPAGVSPANAIVSSPIMHLGGSIGADGMGGGGGGAGGDNFDMYGGIDPTMDPELAMAIRASTEEARAQEEARLRAQQAEAGSGGAAAAAAPSSSSAASGGGFGGAGAVDEEDEDALMQRALEMSMMEMLSVNPDPTRATAAGGASTGQESKTGAGEGDEEDEEAELARALQLSISGSSGTASNSTGASAFADPSFASSLLNSADLNDPMIQAALAQMNAAGTQPPAPPSKEEEKQDEAGKKRKGDDV